MRIALYQPDIPQNTGTILRLAACFGVPVDIIGPAGFDISDRNLRRAGLDYLEHVTLERHESFEAFLKASAIENRRIVLMTTKAETTLYDFAFGPNDTLLFGRESAGVPESVHQAVPVRLRIPIQTGLRSLNLAVAAAIGLSEGLRQTGQFPAVQDPAPQP
jgi:tRNA (cytidine/uridine-2'-O-)-methyltransferase